MASVFEEVMRLLRQDLCAKVLASAGRPRGGPTRGSAT